MDDLTEVQYFCDPCKFSGKRITATGFCKECNGDLCKDCIKAHKNAKDTAKHAIKDIAKLGRNSHKNGIGYCTEHKGILESYCPLHSRVCCRRCITTDHKDCGNLVPLQRAAEGIHETKEADDVSKSLEALLSKFDRTKRDENMAFNAVDVQGKAFEQKVRNFRRDVNKLLDKLELCVIMKRDEVCAEEKKILADRIGTCNKAEPILIQSKNQLDKITSKTDNQVAFVTVKTAKHVVETYKELHDDLVDGQGKFTLKFTPNKDFVEALDSLGSITVRSTVKPTATVEALLNEDDGISEKKLFHSHTVDVRAISDPDTCTITGSTFMSDGRLILADETNKCVKVLSPDLKLVHVFKMTSAPWDLAAISDNEVAVRNSFSDADDEENVIQILEIGAIVKKQHQFAVDGRPRAIKYLEPHLYIACSEAKKAHILLMEKKDKQFKVVKTIKPKNGILNQPQYLAIDANSNIICISDFYNGIVALNMKGEVMFQLLDSNINEYGGITIDESGDIYICAGTPYGIYKIKKTGNELCPLVTWKEGAIDPQAIIYSADTGNFLVTGCCSDKAFVFSYE